MITSYCLFPEEWHLWTFEIENNFCHRPHSKVTFDKNALSNVDLSFLSMQAVHYEAQLQINDKVVDEFY